MVEIFLSKTNNLIDFSNNVQQYNPLYFKYWNVLKTAIYLYYIYKVKYNCIIIIIKQKA